MLLVLDFILIFYLPFLRMKLQKYPEARQMQSQLSIIKQAYIRGHQVIPKVSSIGLRTRILNLKICFLMKLLLL